MFLERLRDSLKICKGKLGRQQDQSCPFQSSLAIIPIGGLAAAIQSTCSSGCCVGKFIMNSGPNNGWTALHQAVWYGHRAVVIRLLQEGANPNQPDYAGETALHQTAWRGHDELTRLLLDEGADLGLRDHRGQTALHHAASNGSKAVVEVLLDKGADPRVEDDDGRKPHSLAEENFHHACAKILRNRETARYGEDVLPDYAVIPRTLRPGPRLDSAVLRFLGVEQNMASIEPYGQASSSTPSKVTTRLNGQTTPSFPPRCPSPSSRGTTSLTTRSSRDCNSLSTPWLSSTILPTARRRLSAKNAGQEQFHEFCCSVRPTHVLT